MATSPKLFEFLLCNGIKLTDFGKGFSPTETIKKGFTYPRGFLYNKPLWTPCRGVAGSDDYENSRDDNKYLANISRIEKPIPLAGMLNPVSSSERTQETIGDLHHTIPVVCSEDKISIIKSWKNKIPMYVETTKYQTLLRPSFGSSYRMHLSAAMSALKDQQILRG